MTDHSRDRGPRPETLAAHGGNRVLAPYRALIEPVHLSTTFERGGDGGYPGGAVYSRDHNPGFKPAEQLLCALEQGAQALLFGSGMAAACAVFRALPEGARLIAPRVMYWSLRNWLQEQAARSHWTLEFFEPAAAGESADACGTRDLAERLGRPLDLLWLETPSNPTWDITDIRAAARLAHAHGPDVVVAVDNTVPTPVFTRPLTLGADLVMHSATKYLGGHGDLLAGAVVGARDDSFWRRVAAERAMGGAVPGAFEAFLLARGMRTLYLRVRHAAATAHRIADHFDGHERLVAVAYPGLASHPGHAIAATQMDDGFGAMLSLRVRGGAAAARAVAGALTVWRQATSLGSTESLVEHRASIEGPRSPCPDDLLRLSVGLESADDLIDDLEQALSAHAACVS
ncbi:MAG: PLP-dependent aspartate aminotransferase family protein [Burkholderiaceae bacterium]